MEWLLMSASYREDAFHASLFLIKVIGRHHHYQRETDHY